MKISNKAIKIVAAGSTMLALFPYLFKKILFFILKHTNDTSIDYDSASAVGIIGGADGPTAIFLASGSYQNRLQIVCTTVAISSAAILIFRKAKKVS